MRDKPYMYCYLDHSSDIKIRGFGRTLNEAFVHVALGMLNVIDSQQHTPTQIQTITIQANTITSTLYDFLNRLLQLFDEGSFVVHITNLHIENTDTFTLTCTVGSVDSQSFINSIKAPTYSEMTIELVEHQYQVTVVVDV